MNRKRVSAKTARTVRNLVLLAMLAGSFSGCASVIGKYRTSTEHLDTSRLAAEGYSIGEDGILKAADATPSSSGTPTVVLDIRNGDRHMERIPISPDKPLFIEDVIKDAKLVNRLGKIHCSIMRQTQPSMPAVRMDVGFDSSGRNVMQEQNYALQPGDRIVISKDNTSWLDKALSSMKKSI